MAFSLLHNPPPRLPAAALLFLAASYLLFGVADHDPWKTEDAIHIGIAWGFATQGHWLFPRVAGEAWPHTAPLYHWVAAMLGSGLQGIIPFHGAARLATPVFGALFLFAVSGAARSFYGTAAGQLAPLLAIGTLGLLLPLHEAQPAVAGLACAAIAYWGAGQIWHGKTRGAILLGLGLGLSFPAHGLVGLLMAIAVLPAPIFRRDWRAVLITLAIALPLLAAWPLLLKANAPHLWQHWWQNEFAEATQARVWPELIHGEQLAWATWPLLPLALWALWLHRQQFDKVLLPLAGAILGIAWFLSGTPRQYALLGPMVPLALLAAAGADKLRRGAASAFGWFGIMTFSFFAVIIWLGASAQTIGWPAQLSRNIARLAPGHAEQIPPLGLLIAGAATLLWLAIWRLPRTPWRPTLQWATGVTLIWILSALLLFGLVDYGKSYRQVAIALKSALPADFDCLERQGVGSAQRASLDYFTGLRTVAPERRRQCNWRLTIDDRERATPDGWQLVWQGRRPRDRNERWFLEKRTP